MRVALFYHSLVSDWNHGNAHFLRGVAREMMSRGIEVRVFEPADGWSRLNLITSYGDEPISRFHAFYPDLKSEAYKISQLSLEEKLDGVDLALVHEWNDPALIAAIGRYRRRNPHIRIFFHDTHHRAITAPHELSRFDLSEFDGVLVYGASLRQAYEDRGWGKRIFVWHEAADTALFRPLPFISKQYDLVWIGNWGDDERTQELQEFLFAPVASLRLGGSVYGVRYPEEAIQQVEDSGLHYCGWLANFDAPEIFAQHRVTVHIPRRPYVRKLTGIPTIRPFEAMACGVPLISAPWEDSEGLFRPGNDYLIARDSREMQQNLRDVLSDTGLALSLIQNGLQTIKARHTCAHRVNELLEHYGTIQAQPTSFIEGETLCK